MSQREENRKKIDPDTLKFLDELKEVFGDIRLVHYRKFDGSVELGRGQ